ncbi:MAG: peroxiredoxin-like family protein, partial [Planctomycetota bacterium]
MRTRETELAAVGARLVFVGTGLPAMAADFARTHAGPHPVLSDPAKKAFRAAGARRSVFTVLHWRMLGNLWRALRGGFRQGRVQGDPWQAGGVLVLDRNGALLHQELDRSSGDALDLDA